MQMIFSVPTKGRRFTCDDVGEAIYFIGCLVVGTAGAVLLCFVVYPALSISLWLRGVRGLWKYFERTSNADLWVREKMALGEDGDEWTLARECAMRKNVSYSNSRSSVRDFCVTALLTTLTGMTVENLLQDLAAAENHQRTNKDHGFNTRLVA